MTDDFENLVWAYRAVFTQTGGSGVIKVTFTFTERTVLLYGSCGLDDYAADRTLRVFLQDSAGNHLGHLIYLSELDNEVVPLILGGTTATVATGTSIDTSQRVICGSGDTLIITMSTPVTSETMTIILRGLVEAYPPTVITTGSGGTVTTTTTYNKVI